MKARNDVTGVVVSADEAAILRLGPGWTVEGEPDPKPKPVSKRAPARK